MLSIFKKEFTTFFSGPTGYLVMGLFLLVNGLLLWYFKGSWNIFNTGFADMQAFFDSTPWLFIFLIPAISMHTFSHEFTTGTIEILKTRPLSGWQIILGKYLAILALIIISLLPTILYAFSISALAQPASIDWGNIIGSYFGLIALASVFSAIGLFTSILSSNQIIAFLLAVLFSFLLYYGIDQWVIWYPDMPNFFQKLSLFEHYKSISKGVLDSTDLLYFICVSFIFLYFTNIKLNK